jgi:phosphatidylethanolamine-binding protein (PEBP) family uncharacterized protein
MKAQLPKTLAILSLALVLLLAACSGGAAATNAPAAPPATPTNEDSAADVDSASPTEEIAEESAGVTSDFVLTSPVMEDEGRLPVDYSCEGQSISPPLAWQGAPEGTVDYALAMHHVPGPGDTHWYWVVYDIPASVTSVEAGQTDFGTFGTNSVNDGREYAPPCSQGEGDKLYTITVYALSASPDLPDPSQVDRDTLLAAIEDITLAEASMDVWFNRYDY